jgi:hypothetical protein
MSSAPTYLDLIAQKNKLYGLVRDLRERLVDEHALLQCALHELAAARGAKDRQAFARRWVNQQRNAWQSDPIPVSREESPRA